MFAKLKLRNRLLIGYTIPMAVYLGLAFLVYSSASQISQTFQEVSRVQKLIIEANSMAVNVQEMIRNARGYIIDSNPEFEKEYQGNIEDALKEAKALEALIRKPEQKERLDKMISLIQEYDFFTKGLINQLKQGKKAEALALFKSNKGQVFISKFDELNEIFNKTEQDLLATQTKQANETLGFLILAVIIGSFLLLAMKLTIAWVISAGIAKTIDGAINAISSSSREIAVTVEQQERSTSQQAVSVNETTTTIHELGTSAQTTAAQAEAAAAGTRQVLALVNGNENDFAQKSIHGKLSLRERVAQISQQILQLSEQTYQIGNISTLVSDLANQTNMLALNAAVEAVRAGERGKGFGVVAAEIRKLADQSRKSAEKINALVTDIQNSTQTTVMVTEEGSRTVGSVVEAIDTIAINAQQISLTAKQQAIAIQQVVDAMNTVNQGAAQTASGIGQVKIGTAKLNEAAINLQTVVYGETK